MAKALTRPLISQALSTGVLAKWMWRSGTRAGQRDTGTQAHAHSERDRERLRKKRGKSDLGDGMMVAQWVCVVRVVRALVMAKMVCGRRLWT